MRRRDLLSAAAAVAGGAGCAQTPAGLTPPAAAPGFTAADLQQATRLRDAALADGTAWQLLQALCTQVGARPAGSAADARAVAWAQAALKDLGLAQVRAEPLPIRTWVRGPASAQLLAPVAQPLVMLALGNSVATPAGGIEADVA
jgi:carboxypeptidase Q